MATIGTFTAADNGYGGSVKTLTLNFRAKLVPTEKDNDKAPDYRIIAGNIECGEGTPPGTRARAILTGSVASVFSGKAKTTLVVLRGHRRKDAV